MSELHMAWPFLGPSLGPFSSPSIPLQVSSSANFSSAHAGDSLTTITVPNQFQLVFLTYPSGCLVTISSPLHPGYAYVLHDISVQQLQATTYSLPSQLHLSSGLACTHLSSSPDKCSLMGLWSATIKIPLWIVIGCLFLTVNLPVP